MGSALATGLVPGMGDMSTCGKAEDRTAIEQDGNQSTSSQVTLQGRLCGLDRVIQNFAHRWNPPTTNTHEAKSHWPLSLKTSPQISRYSHQQRLLANILADSEITKIQRLSKIMLGLINDHMDNISS